MVRKKKNISLKKICIWAFALAFLVIVSVINYNKLKHNYYANYEQAVDFSSYNDAETQLSPVIAAIFYADKKTDKIRITTYLNHINNYKRKNVKIVLVPTDINKDSQEVVEKLYDEIRKNNQIEKVALLYEDDSNIELHTQMIRNVMTVEDIMQVNINDAALKTDDIFQEYLNKENSILIVLTNLSNHLQENNFLINEIVFWAQKYNFKMNVFDVIDTKMAGSLDKDYASRYQILQGENMSLLQKQKENLEHYKEKYGADLISYYKLNISQLSEKHQITLPEQNADTYRLFDRGTVIIKGYDKNSQEIFSYLNNNSKKGIVGLIAEIAQKIAKNNLQNNLKYSKIYLLTNEEKIAKDKNTLLINYLDGDDGVEAKYKNRKAIIIGDERPDDPIELETMLRQKAKIPENVPDSKINFYKFKTVEIENEN